MPLLSRRNVLLLVLPIIILVAATPFIVFRWMIPRDPLDANMAQLGRWLATYDVRDQTLEVQQTLVDRIQSSMPTLEATASNDHRFSSRQQDQLLTNAERLQQVWFEKRSRQSSELNNNPQRVEFFRKQVATLLQMANLANRLITPTDNQEDGEAMRQFLANVARWQVEAAPNLRQVMKDGVRDGLLVYLAYFNVSDISPGSRRSLAVRTAKALDSPGSPQMPPVKLEGPARKTLQTNAALLMEVWFQVQAVEYDNTGVAERPHFVVDLVARVKAWDLPKLLSGSDSQSKADQTKLLLHLQEQTELWIDRAPSELSSKMQALTYAVRQQLVWDSLRGFIPFLGGQH
jgi:hypothetical protein